MGIKKGASALWYSELSLHQLGSRPTVFIPRWTTHPCIVYEVCATRGAWLCCSVRYYSTWLNPSIHSILWGNFAGLVHVTNFPPSYKWGHYVTIIFLESLYSFYWRMRLNKCRPSGLLAQEHSNWFKPPRHMPTTMAVYSSINCSQDQ